jgi:predicted transposase YdaD
VEIGVEASVQTDPHRQEMQAVKRTILDEWKDEGRKEGRKKGRQEGREEGRREEAIRTRQQTLLRQLRARFPDVPQATTDVVNATRDVAQLDAWLDRVVSARNLDEVGIGPAP